MVCNLNFKNIPLRNSLLITIASVFFLLPTVTNVYIFDDEALIRDNASIGSIDKLPSFFTSNIFGDKETGPLYRPLLMTSLFLNRVIFGHHALAYHLVNLLLHALASLLFYQVLAGFFGHSYKSLIPALFFAVHFVHLDNVAFIINRSDIISLIFLFSGFLVLQKDKGWENYFKFSFSSLDEIGHGYILKTFSASICLFFAFLSKESSIPILIILLLFCFMKWLGYKQIPPWRPVGIGILIFFAFLSLYLVMRHQAIGGFGLGGAQATFFADRSLSSVVPTMSRVFADYIYSFFVPSSFSVDYSNYRISEGIFEWRAILSYVVHLAILSIAIWRYKKNSLLSFCILAFYITLLPVSQIIPFLDIKAMRFLYIPSIFFFLLVSMPLNYLRKESRYFRAVLVFYTALILFFGSFSFKYSNFFESGKILWSEMAKRSPDNLKIRFNLGNQLYKDGNYEDSIIFLEDLVKKKKDYIQAYTPLAISYAKIGKRDKAEAFFLEGLKINPDYPILNFNYAVFSYLNGDLNTAQRYITRAKNLSPSDGRIESIQRGIDVKISEKNKE